MTTSDERLSHRTAIPAEQTGNRLMWKTGHCGGDQSHHPYYITKSQYHGITQACSSFDMDRHFIFCRSLTLHRFQDGLSPQNRHSKLLLTDACNPHAKSHGVVSRHATIASNS